MCVELSIQDKKIRMIIKTTKFTYQTETLGRFLKGEGRAEGLELGRFPVGSSLLISIFSGDSSLSEMDSASIKKYVNI